jgi:hypothetical protein
MILQGIQLCFLYVKDYVKQLNIPINVEFIKSAMSEIKERTESTSRKACFISLHTNV